MAIEAIGAAVIFFYLMFLLFRFLRRDLRSRRNEWVFWWAISPCEI